MKRKLKWAGICTCLLLSASALRAQTSSDTILIDGKNINTAVLKPGTNRYLMYMQMAVDSPRISVQFWSNNIDYLNYQGREAIQISYEWQDKDTVFHTVRSICDRKTMQPFYQEEWWKAGQRSAYDYINKSATLAGVPLTDADTLPNRKGPWNAFKKAVNEYTLLYNLDLEIFPVLPYQKGKTFLIPFYQPGSVAPKNEAFTVMGSEILKSYDNQNIDCWILKHQTKIKTRTGDWVSTETYWIGKKAKEVLKMEQLINGKQLRHKLKLPHNS